MGMGVAVERQSCRERELIWGVGGCGCGMQFFCWGRGGLSLGFHGCVCEGEGEGGGVWKEVGGGICWGGGIEESSLLQPLGCVWGGVCVQAATVQDSRSVGHVWEGWEGGGGKWGVEIDVNPREQSVGEWAGDGVEGGGGMGGSLLGRDRSNSQECRKEREGGREGGRKIFQKKKVNTTPF